MNLKLLPVQHQVDENGDLDDENDFIMSDSSIQQFEDNDSTLNRKLLEEEIKMIVRMLQQHGGDKMQNSTHLQPSNDTSQRYGMTLSKPFVLSQNNLAMSTASIQQPFVASADYQSQWFSESLSMSKFRIPQFFESPNNRANEEDERISEVQSYQENLSTIPLSYDERLQLLVNQSLIIKDCIDQQQMARPRFYELMSNEASVGGEGNITISQSNGNKKRLGIFKFNASKGSKQEFSLNTQQTVNLNPNNPKCSWTFKALNTQSLVALQVVKRVLALEDVYIMGNHTVTIKKIELQQPDSCNVQLQFRRLDDQLYFNKINVSLKQEGIIFGKNKKTSHIYLDADKEASSNHCKMAYDPQYKCAFIMDNGSTNGTWIQIKGGKQENLSQKMHIQIDVKRDIMIYDCIEHTNLDIIRKSLQSACIVCNKNNRNTRNLKNYKIEMCVVCASNAFSTENWAQIIF